MGPKAKKTAGGAKATYDPTKDGAALGCALMSAVVLVIGGSILCLIGIFLYRILDFNRILPMMGILLVVFLVLWTRLIYMNPASSKLGLTTFKMVGVTIAAAAGSMITCLALVFLGNGCGDKTTLIRDAVCEEKWHSAGNRRTYTAKIRMPGNAGRLIDLSIKKEEYDRIVEGKSLMRLTTASGNLHLEWIRKQELVNGPGEPGAVD